MRVNYWHTFEETQYYHIYNRTNGKEYLFVNEGNYRYFLKKWQRYFNPYLDTLAYCLIHNHFHFIVRIKSVNIDIRKAAHLENSRAGFDFFEGLINYNSFLEDQFRRFFNSYSAAFNRQQQRHGSLFQPKFKRVILPNLDKILDRMAYVHHNPLHHNYSPFYDVWTYSSYMSYLSDKPTRLARDLGLSLFCKAANINLSDMSMLHKIFIDYHNQFHQCWLKEQTWEDFEIE